MKTYKSFLILFAFVGLFFTTSCNDLDPTLDQDKEIEGNINTDEDLFGIIKGAYNRMTSNVYYGRDMIINNEVRCDNTFANGNSGRFTTQGSFTYNPSSGLGVWAEAYRVISSANLVINAQGIDGDQTYINYLKGQALAIRALAHFDLMRNYGQQYVGGNLGVPYVTEYKGNESSPARLTIAEVKSKIYADLEQAFSMMSSNYNDPQYITKYAVKGIESKVATYFGDWDRVISSSQVVINSGLYSIVEKNAYVASFGQDTSVNSVFELAFSSTDNQGINGLGYMYRLGSTGSGYGDIEVLDNVLDLYEEGDVRADILGYQFGLLRNMGKFPSLNGYDNVNIIRYEEIILNYAEALVMTGGDALTQINKITAKRGATAYTVITRDDVLKERRKELIFEGFRFDDLVRTGRGIPHVEIKQNISSSISSGDYRLAFPIPVKEMDSNSNMVQNLGY